MNNKFKRFNKILMMTVAILLCFVLISTSVVSGIFAKYVITKSAGATVSLKAFGVTLTVEGAQGSVSYSPSGSTSADAVSVTVTGLQLVPGQTVDDVLKVTITGNGTTSSKPNVDAVRLKIKVKSENVTKFSVAKSAIKSATAVDFATANFVPIGFRIYSGTAAATSTTTKDFSKTWKTPASDAAFATVIRDGIVSSGFGFTAVDDSTDDTAVKTIYDKNNSITSLNVKYLNFGFSCVADNTGMPSDVSAVEADLIQTHLSTINSTAQLKITFTVSLEQVV